MVYAEPLVVLAIFAVLLYASIRARKFLRWIKSSGPAGFGIVLISLGAVVFLLVTARLVTPTGLTEDQLVQGALALIVGGAGFVIIDFILKKLRKKEIVGLEEERRDYIKRVRKGLTLDEAESKAKKLIKGKGKKNVKIIASDREFKTWTVFLESGEEKFKVTIDMDGDIVEWETLDKLPTYLTGA